jgi:dTDP-4-amino-4,6-dideoxygalactose transaminase
VPPACSGHAWHLFTIGLSLDLLTINRNEFIKALIERGVGASVHYKPLHLMSYYRETYGFKDEDFPRAVERYNAAVSLPIYPSLTDEQVERIITEVISLGKKYRRSHG